MKTYTLDKLALAEKDAAKMSRNGKNLVFLSMEPSGDSQVLEVGYPNETPRNGAVIAMYQKGKKMNVR